MSTVTSYPIRLEKKIIDAVRPIAKREGRTIKAQIERLIRIGMVAEPPWMLKTPRAAVSGQKP
jgi:hypothetical protein